jgi:hypothetical protein
VKPPKHRRIAGWREWVAFPDLGVPRIKAKLDTGARSSALHAFAIREFTDDGRRMVRFEVHPVQRRSEKAVEVVAELLERRLVRPSSGVDQLRRVIATTLEMDGRSWQIELTLARRDAMGFRLLLGRQALRGRYLVDPGRSFVFGKPG